MRFNPKPTFCAALIALAFGAQPALALLIVDTSNAPGVAIDAQYPTITCSTFRPARPSA
jgi:hypothetical protein